MQGKIMTQSARSFKNAATFIVAFALFFSTHPTMANARIEGSEVGFSDINLSGRAANVHTGIGIRNSNNPELSFTWYKCSANTSFIAMVPYVQTIEIPLTVVNSESVLDGKLEEAGCVLLDGVVGDYISITNFYNADGTLKDPTKPFLSAKTLLTPPDGVPQQPHSAISQGAYLKTSTNPIPGMEKVGDDYVSTDPTFVDGGGEYVTTVNYYSWVACDGPVVGGFKLHEWFQSDVDISGTPVVNCQRLYTAWEQEEGWSGTRVSGLSLNPDAVTLYTNDPASEYEPFAVDGVPTAINIDGKYLVRTIDAYPYFGWSSGVEVGDPVDPVTPAVSGKASSKIIFAGDSAVLTASAKSVLSKFVSSKKLKTKKTVKVTVVGYTLFVAGTTNDAKLSKARAAAVTSYLKKLGVKATFTNKGAGVSGLKNAQARNATISVTWKG